jgi:hypothetical protein
VTRPWSWYLRCQSCGHGHPTLPGCTRAKTSASPTDMLVCRSCGNTGFDDPRPGRTVSDAVWWNPWTWGATRWEWRDDAARALPGGGAA